MMTDGILTDVQIAALSPEQRRELITRLRQPLSDMIDPAVLTRTRRIRLSLMIGGSIAMIPWLAYLSMTLPDNYVAHNWPATWMGFDALIGQVHGGDRRVRDTCVARCWCLRPSPPACCWSATRGST